MQNSAPAPVESAFGLFSQNKTLNLVQYRIKGRKNISLISVFNLKRTAGRKGKTAPTAPWLFSQVLNRDKDTTADYEL